RPPPRATLSPYTTLFRSHPGKACDLLQQLVVAVALLDAKHRRVVNQRGAAPASCLNMAVQRVVANIEHPIGIPGVDGGAACIESDRKSTRLNSSHVKISY